MSPRNTLLLSLLLAALAATLALLLGGAFDEGAPRELERGLQTSAVRPPPGELPEVVGRSSRRTPAAPAEGLGELAEGGDELIEDALPDGSTRVEVRVLRPEPWPAAGPHPFAGGRVLTQSWIEATEATAQHEAELDEQGVAVFRFEGATHLDWFRADTGAGTFAMGAFVESHVDVAAGSVYRITLAPVATGSVRGRVTTLEGTPLAGVEVGAWIDTNGEIEETTGEWYPGHFSTTSGEGGWFEFAALPAGFVDVAVRPGEWLQVLPDLRGNYGEELYFELAPAERRALGAIRLTPRTVLRVLVTDLDGEPVSGALVQAQPLEFADPRLLPEDDYHERFLPDDATEQQRAVLERASEFYGPWSYGEFAASTDADGVARVSAVPGRWRLTVVSRLAGRGQAVERVVQLPLEEVEVRLSLRLTDLRGDLVDLDSAAPVEGASVRLEQGGGRESARTLADGSFSFEDVALGGPYTLEVIHPGYHVQAWTFPPTELRPQLAARRALDLTGRVTGSDGAPLAGRRVQLLSGTLAPEVAGLSEAQAWLAAQGTPLQESELGSNGDFRFGRLWPGSYEVGLVLPVATGELDAWGEPLAEHRVWQRWTLSPGASLQPLVVDLGAYDPAEMVDYCTIVGRVLSSEGRTPLAGARVEVTRGDRVRVFETSARGSYSFQLPVGEASMEIRHPEHETLFVPEKRYGRGGQRPTWILRRGD